MADFDKVQTKVPTKGGLHYYIQDETELSRKTIASYMTGARGILRYIGEYYVSRKVIATDIESETHLSG